jgi:hypothetical protein
MSFGPWLRPRCFPLLCRNRVQWSGSRIFRQFGNSPRQQQAKRRCRTHAARVSARCSFCSRTAATAEFAKSAAAALENPVWGIWLGRKSCIPSEPLCRGTFESEPDAVRHLLGDTPLSSFTTVRDVYDSEGATDALRDQPVSFGEISSSGTHLREYAIRRVCVRVAETPNKNEGPASATEDP